MRKARDDQRRARLGLLAGIILSAVACGSEDPTPPGSTSSLFPVKVGNRWEIQITDASGLVSSKVQSVLSENEDGFTFQTLRGNREVTSVQKIDEEGRLVRTQEQTVREGVVTERLSYQPPSLRLDLVKTKLGDSFEYTFTEQRLAPDGTVESTKEKTQQFTIEAVDEQVTVPGGTFTCTRVRRVTVNGPEKTYWYARGVGKIKELGGQTEELVRADLPEQP